MSYPTNRVAERFMLEPVPMCRLTDIDVDISYNVTYPDKRVPDEIKLKIAKLWSEFDLENIVMMK